MAIFAKRSLTSKANKLLVLRAYELVPNSDESQAWLRLAERIKNILSALGQLSIWTDS